MLVLFFKLGYSEYIRGEHPYRRRRKISVRHSRMGQLWRGEHYMDRETGAPVLWIVEMATQEEGARAIEQLKDGMDEAP